MATTCSHVNPDGTSCGVVVGDGQEHCLWHDKSRAEQATAARRKGAARANARREKKVRTADPRDLPGPLTTLEEAALWGSWLVRAVTTGVIDARTAGEATRALRAFTDARKYSDRVDERVRALQKQLQALRDAGGRR